MRQYISLRNALMCGAAVLGLAAAPPAVAQGAKAGQLEEVVVTAQRSETTLQRTPVSVSTFSAATLQQRGSVDLLDLSTFTPNLSVAARAGSAGSQASFAIRGMGVGAGDSTAGVGVYVDEVYFPSSYGNVLGLLDVDRIEVLRGPQGTLFGRNTIAGAVQYISAKPQNTFGGYVEGTLGDGRRSAIGAVNAPIGERLSLRFSGIVDHRGGYVTDDLNGVKVGRSDTTTGRFQARWTPTDRLTVDIRAEASKQNSNGRPVAIIGVNPNAQFAGLASRAGETRPLTTAYISTRKYHFAGYNVPDYFRSRQNAFSAILNYDLTDKITFKSITAYQNNRNHLVTDADLTPLNILAADRGVLTDHVFTQEGQLRGSSLGDRLKWTAGVYYYGGSQTTRGSFSQIGLGPIAPMTDTRIENKALAGYGQATFNLTEQVSVVAGVRKSREQVENTNLNRNLTYKNTFNDTSPHFGVNYQATPNALFYVKASKGFRAGGLTVNSALPGGSIAFSPEIAWAYEAGARLEFLDRRLRINPTIFYTDWRDIQFNLRIPVGATLVVATQNAGTAHLKGGELEAQFAATDRLLLTASASVLDSHYTAVPNIPLATFPRGYLASLTGAPGTLVTVANLDVNQPLQQAPKYKYSLGARYTQPLSSGATVVANIDWGWTDEQRSVVTTYSGITLPAYGLLNGRVQYQAPGGRWSVSLYGTNLLNKYYWVGANGFGKSFSIGADEADLGRPREYGVTVRASF